MSEEFHRIKRLPPYVFEVVNKLKAKARAEGRDIIDFGMGNPDMPTPPHIVEKLVEAVRDPRTHRYSASRGIPGLRKAQAAYYERRFGVKLNPETEVIATLGSKEGLANLAQAITAPGDVILVPNPAYPIHAFGFIISGAVVRSIPFEADDAFFHLAERAVKHSVPKPIALVINYPSNPTAQIASLDFYREVVAFCARHDMYLISDLAYSEIYFDGIEPPPSVLQVPGAKERTVEFTTLSKTYAMPGWRMGFAVGNGGDKRAWPREVLSRLWRLHADPGRRRCRAQRAAGMRAGNPDDLSASPRCSRREHGACGLGYSEPACLDVCMVAHP